MCGVTSENGNKKENFTDLQFKKIQLESLSSEVPIRMFLVETSLTTIHVKKYSHFLDRLVSIYLVRVQVSNKT